MFADWSDEGREVLRRVLANATGATTMSQSKAPRARTIEDVRRLVSAWKTHAWHHTPASACQVKS